MVIIGSSFVKTRTNGNGGAISLHSGINANSISDSTFTANSAQALGGSLHLEHAACLLSNTHFNQNNASAAGAIAVTLESTVACTGCHFRANNAFGNGGAVSIQSGSEFISEDADTFIGNHATLFGGAIMLQDKQSTLRMHRTQIIDCKAMQVRARVRGMMNARV